MKTKTRSWTTKEKLEAFNKIRNDPIEFAKGVYTLDEADSSEPIKRFPIHLTYIVYYIKIWMVVKRIVVPKSRRMKMSWTNIMLHVWLAAFHSGQHIAFTSKKEEDADWLIKKRAKFILDNLDPNIIPVDMIPNYTYKYCVLEFPDIHSTIQGFPQGADQMRQFTFSAILADEFAFWPLAEATYSAAKPTLEGGGRFTGISSPAPGFFKRMVLDNLNSKQLRERAEEEINEIKQYPMEGIEIWRNKVNGITVFQIHYTADPAKRSAEWKEENSKDMPISTWDQEYELKWESYEGVPVYRDFRRLIHGTTERLKPHLGLPLLRGFDFGLCPAAVICQLREGTLYVIREFTELNMGIDRFSDIVLERCRILFPQWADLKNDWFDCVDPAGFHRVETDESCCAEILQSKGIIPMPGAIVWEKRRKSVENFLVKLHDGEPCFKIDLATCPVLVRGFEGGYRYPDKIIDMEPNKIKPLKDIHSHPHDALQMITTSITMIGTMSRRRIKIPRLSYSNRGINRINAKPNRGFGKLNAR